MLSHFLKAKLHHIRVTEAELEYEGSLTIDRDLMDAIGIRPFEKLLIADLENGNRFETYAIEGKRGSGVCCLNGAVAHLGKIGDRLIVMVFCLLTEVEAAVHQPRIVRLDDNNKIAAKAI